MGKSHPVYGLEEEVFILEPDRPTGRSLYYLARLLWNNPGWYYTHSASNFTRGRDMRYGIVSGVELSTGRHDSITALLQDLADRRRDLATVCEGLVCPIGNLPTRAQPSDTCGLHIHVSSIDREAAYLRLCRYLPVYALALAHAPYAGGRRFGQSYRWANSFAIGPLREDPTYRFQDMIFSRRLGTLEIRVFDPSPDLSHIRNVLHSLAELLSLGRGHVPADAMDPAVLRSEYNYQRERLARLRADDLPGGAADGVFGTHGTDLAGLVAELHELAGFEAAWVQSTPADGTAARLRESGLVPAYQELDDGYRRSAHAPPWNGKRMPLVLAATAGVLGYYLPRMPYTVWKAWKEWH